MMPKPPEKELNKTEPLFAMEVLKIGRQKKLGLPIGSRYVRLKMHWMAWQEGYPLVHREEMIFEVFHTFNLQIPREVMLELIHVIKEKNIVQKKEEQS